MNANEIRAHFPYFDSGQNKDSIYFDNAATTHKPHAVINKVVDYYQNDNSNIHRSVNKLASKATHKYELVRERIKDFIGAKKKSEIIFTGGTTDCINLIAQSYVRPVVKENDIILISPLEHHSNLVPWQNLAKQTGAQLKFMPIDNELLIDTEGLKTFLNKKVKFIATHHISNVTGCEQNIKKIIQLANAFKIPVLVDGAQSVAHSPVNVSELDCAFYCFSGHKIFGPTGTGVLFGKEEFLENCIPSKLGGGMVAEVESWQSSWSELPHKLEAGTPNIAGIIGLGEAIGFVQKIGFSNILKHENKLTRKFEKLITNISGVEIYGKQKKTAPIFTFNIDGLHHYDIASILGEHNIYTRSGHLCAQTLMSHCGISGAVRASMSIYNSEAEIEQFMLILKKTISFLRK
ncbi:MAG: cysteine desulfurase [Flavobacteriales bacterium]|jgi:cysteine desulfurase/selenocysteine lyase|nr:cysteine desulfurase [Flavobacteriales bacterium]|tara:strand:- start:686 stop:1900 length:1215 start_codon:yes stop_codon:yes gene_type:complete